MNIDLVNYLSYFDWVRWERLDWIVKRLELVERDVVRVCYCCLNVWIDFHNLDFDRDEWRIRRERFHLSLEFHQRVSHSNNLYDEEEQSLEEGDLHHHHRQHSKTPSSELSYPNSYSVQQHHKDPNDATSLYRFLNHPIYR